jgi:hypothetical protein
LVISAAPARSPGAEVGRRGRVEEEEDAEGGEVVVALRAMVV